MHFFEKQRVGLIGQTSVSLQKILIFFMICNLFSFFSGGFLQFFLCLIGFIGAYKKKPCLLSIYFWVNIAIILFSLVSLLFVYNSAPQYDQYSSASSSSVEQWQTLSSGSNDIHPVQQWEQHPIFATARKIASFTSDFSSSSQAPVSSSTSASDYASSSSNDASSAPSIDILILEESSYPSSSESDSAVTVISIAFILALLLIFIFAYLQAKALALAWRLRKLLLLPSIPIITEPTPQAAEQVHYFPTQENSCAESEPQQHQAQQQAQPQQQQQQQQPANTNYVAPYPYYPYYPQYAPQGMINIPHQPPMYWGQPHMYYSYAPQSQQPQSGEKQ